MDLMFLLGFLTAPAVMLLGLALWDIALNVKVKHDRCHRGSIRMRKTIKKPPTRVCE